MERTVVSLELQEKVKFSVGIWRLEAERQPQVNFLISACTLGSVICFCKFLLECTGCCLLSTFLPGNPDAAVTRLRSHSLIQQKPDTPVSLAVATVQRAFGILWHLTAFPSSKTDINQKPPIQNKNARQNTTHIPPILGKSGLET